MSDHRQETKNAEAWEALFQKYHILDEISQKGFYRISANQIRAYREPRLMAKFDHSINLPRIFAENHLAILPVTRGDYLIAPFQAYWTFEPDTSPVTQMCLPVHLQSLHPEKIPSESVAINCALAAGIFQDFLGEPDLQPTVSGRMGTESFDFQIPCTQGNPCLRVEVSNAQIEIDAALEGRDSLTLIEAKRDLSEDFLVRQLYYPYRVWHGRVSKQVRTVFLVYTNGIFRLYEYAFENPALYGDLKLIRQKNYAIEDTRLSLADLLEGLKGLPLTTEPSIPFPQADRFDRVVNLCELLLNGPLNREEVTEEYAFDTRQTNYYTDAGRYLGLIARTYQGDRKPIYTLTSLGRKILGLAYRPRQLALCRLILSHQVFRDSFQAVMETGIIPGKATIVGIMKESGLYHVDQDSTYLRRASTVSGWLHWILNLIQDEQIL